MTPRRRKSSQTAVHPEPLYPSLALPGQWFQASTEGFDLVRALELLRVLELRTCDGGGQIR